MKSVVIPTTKGKRLKDGRVIIDELCVCGRLQSCHSPLVTNVGGTLAAQKGHGDAPGCEQFTWISFKLEDGTFWPDPAPIVPR